MENHEITTQEDSLHPATFATLASSLNKGALLPLVYAYNTFL